jgi:hypothetical protein
MNISLEGDRPFLLSDCLLSDDQESQRQPKHHRLGPKETHRNTNKKRECLPNKTNSTTAGHQRKLPTKAE